jgi:hypothetical protein
MNWRLILIFILPLSVIGQPAKFPGKADLEKVYSQAIADFIKGAKEKNKAVFDTLFIANALTGSRTIFRILNCQAG